MSGMATVIEQTRALAAEVFAACSVPTSTRSQGEWAELVTACQGMLNTLSAAQDAAIARMVAIEWVWAPDGSTAERVHAPGWVSLDGPDLVASTLSVSHQHAQARVDEAVALAAGVAPSAGPGDPRVPSGLGALHEQMAAGQVDAYRAGVVASELAGVPADVVKQVLDQIVGYVEEPGPVLRRRTRRVLARVSPEHARERTVAARRECGLRRWVADPGVDAWLARVPVEEAAPAWAAIDELARRYVADAACADLERARGKALTDLVTGHSTGTYAVHLTTTLESALAATESAPGRVSGEGVPAPAVGAAVAAPDEARVSLSGPGVPGPGVGAPEDAPLSRPSGSPALSPTRPDRGSARAARRGSDRLVRASGGVKTAAVTGGQGQPAADPAPSNPGASTPVQSAPGQSGPGALGPGASVPGASAPLASGSGASAPDASGPGASDPAIGDLVSVVLTGSSEPRLVPRDWLQQATSAAKTCKTLACSPSTGALVDPGGQLTSTAYQPGERLRALVKARDGRCRFPGCSIAAVFCDLDHVTPWPAGPTAAVNLICLCRRHHRIKQAPVGGCGCTPTPPSPGPIHWAGNTSPTRSTASSTSCCPHLPTPSTTPTPPPTRITRIASPTRSVAS